MYYGFKIIYKNPNEVHCHEEVAFTRLERDLVIDEQIRRGNTLIMSKGYGVI